VLYKLHLMGCTSIKRLVNGYLASSLGVSTNNEEVTGIKGRNIPLYQGGYNQKILYISGVAMRISKSQNSPAMKIAEAIAGHLSQNSNSLFNVQVVSPGWIYVELMDSTLADWLHCFTVNRNENSDLEQFPLKEKITCDPHYQLTNSLTIFNIQYAYSRCFSLLRLAHQERLIELDITDVKIFLSAKAIPWLNSDQKLRLNHPDESFLIHQLVKVVDNLVCTDSGSSINWEKAGINLSQAFERFWSSCRIWGEVKIHSPELAQGRLGLLILTQLVLRSVLEDKLGIVAPVEL
jgi:hypothetical protein